MYGMYRHSLVSKIALITIIFASMFGLLHIMNRNLANDMPQLLATQGAKIVDAYGVEAVNSQPTDLANNPVPFVIVYDKQSKPLAGTGYLGAKLAQTPKGVINHATAGKPHTVTWQPKEGVRIASVTVLSKKGYFVVGGQSLSATEARASRLLWFTLLGYGAALAVVGIVAWFGRRFHQPHKNQCACCMHGGSCPCEGESQSASVIRADKTDKKPKNATKKSTLQTKTKK